MACSHGDVPVPELLDVEAAAAVPSAAVSHEVELWQFLSLLHAAWTMPWLSGQSSMLEGLGAAVWLLGSVQRRNILCISIVVVPL